MGLKDLYTISELLGASITKGEFDEDFKESALITLTIDPVKYYGIDKEFYYMTHGNTYKGFQHSKEFINATINGIKFRIYPKKQTKEEE